MNKLKTILSLSLFSLAFFAAVATAQETPPAPGSPKPVVVPAVKQKKLPNGLTVAVAERKGVPLVAVQLMVGTGSTYEEMETAGLVKTSLDLLTKGTKTRNATKIANDVELLGGNLSTNVGMDFSGISLNVTSDKIAQGLEVLSDVVLHPTFPQAEIDLAKSQALDELKYNLKQPGFLASYVATAYSFYVSPMGGTPQSLSALKRKDILEFYRDSFLPDRATLIFVGDIDAKTAFALAQTKFGMWKSPPPELSTGPIASITASVSENKRREQEQPLLKRILVIDLPKSGQAAVSFARHMGYAGNITWDDKRNAGKISDTFFPGIVFDSILGGGYSSRLNMEIRIKRGLSYGAGSSINWRAYDSRFSARAQTKNESAAEVAELLIDQLESLQKSDAETAELRSRQAALIGTFSRRIETNSGLLSAISELYSNWLDSSELNAYLANVEAIDLKDVREFAAQNLNGGDLIIVGDYSIFKDDLTKRFPKMSIEVIKADDLDISKLRQD